MQNELEKILADWPKEPRESAGRLIKEYGQPDEFSESRLMWFNTRDGWKRSILSNNPTPHSFPDKHNDVLEQFIDYKVPLEMYSTLAEFDGSIVVDRTRGEMSARCGGTSMNFVAINLANDIIKGKYSVDEARAEYTKLYQAYQNGEHPPYTKSFQFEVPKGGTADPDVKTLGAAGEGIMLWSAVGKAEDDRLRLFFRVLLLNPWFGLVRVFSWLSKETTKPHEKTRTRSNCCASIERAALDRR
jgi:hypothetical protein